MPTIPSSPSSPSAELQHLHQERADQYWTLQVAMRYGGGFYRRLAEAGLCADPVNRQRIFDAFPDLLTVYGPQTLQHRQVRNGGKPEYM